jgi:hypothetical protein
MEEELKNRCKWCDAGEIRSKGLCGVCYRLDRLLIKAQRWDLTEAALPLFLRWFRKPNFNDHGRLKEAAIRALESLIADRQHLGYSLKNESLSGIDLEHLIRNVFGKIKGANKKKVEAEYFHTADFFDMRFSPEQKVDLYRFLKRVFYSISLPSLTLLIIEAYYKS